MFKDDYKSCFDKITGDEKLLEEILSKADKATNKRIQFKRVYRYTASLAAAFVVVVSSAFLYNNGTLKPDVKEIPSNTVSVEDKNPVLSEKIIVPETEASFTEDKKQSISNNTIQEKHIQPKIEASNEENSIIASDSTSESNLNNGIMAASLPSQDNENISMPSEEIAAYSGGGAPSKERSLDTATEDTGFDFSLNIFKEGILSTPETIYNESGDKVLIYTDAAAEKRIVLILSETGIKTYESSVILRVDENYIELFTEGISEEYKTEIISSFIDK